MRTRLYNKMRAQEIEDYLNRGGDTIILAVGVIECHGYMPMDVETILPEAIAVLLAEKADALALTGFPFFYPGGTVISPSTIRFSIRQCIEHLDIVCHSLVKQGFKKLILVTGHGPSSLYINAFCRDFFEETLIHPCHISNVSGRPFSFEAMAEKKKEKPTEPWGDMDLKCYGAYKIMGQMDYLEVDPDVSEPLAPMMPADEVADNFAKLCFKHGGVCAQLYGNKDMHSSGRIFKSEEERLEACKKGEALLRQDVEECDIKGYLKALDDYQNYAQKLVSKHPYIQR